MAVTHACKMDNIQCESYEDVDLPGLKLPDHGFHRANMLCDLNPTEALNR